MKLTRHPCPKCLDETIFTGLICSRCGYVKPNPLTAGWEKVKKVRARVYAQHGKVKGAAVMRALADRQNYLRNMDRKARGERFVDVPHLGSGNKRRVPSTAKTPAFRK